MRGFRGSRAAQNVMAFRHGRNVDQSFQGNGNRFQQIQSPNGARPQLPDWMKTPETRAVEAMQQPARAQLKAVPHPAMSQPVQATAKRGDLKLVSSAGQSVAAPRAKKAATPTSKKKAPAKARKPAAAKKATASRTASKRKAA